MKSLFVRVSHYSRNILCFLKRSGVESKFQAIVLVNPKHERKKTTLELINRLPPSYAVPKQKKKLQDLFSSVLSQLKKNITTLKT